MPAEKSLPRIALIGPEDDRLRWRKDLGEFVEITVDASLADLPTQPDLKLADLVITDNIGLAGAVHLRQGGTILIRDEPTDCDFVDVFLPTGYFRRELICAVRLLSRATYSERYVKVLHPYLDKVLDEARMDSTTELLSRNGWNKQVSSLPADEFPLCLVFLDLDNFKYCNGAVNWSFGDEVLKKIGAMLRQHAHEDDIAARWGGDEFALLFSKTDTEAGSQRIEQLRSAIAVHRFPEHPEVAISASVGYAAMSSADEFDAAFAACQQALREAKRRGGNCSVFAAEA